MVFLLESVPDIVRKSLCNQQPAARRAIPIHSSGPMTADGTVTTAADSQVPYTRVRAVLTAAAKPMTTIPAQFDATLAAAPDKEALFGRDASLTFRQLHTEAVAAAQALAHKKADSNTSSALTRFRSLLFAW